MQRKLPFRFIFLVLLSASSVHAEGLSLIVISEIHYHPFGRGDDLEFIELYNATPAPMDLSGWFFSDGVAFEFPEGTWIHGSEFLVVARDPDRLRDAYNVENVIGGWSDCCVLDNGGETIDLSEANGILHARVDYNDRGRWPAAADGIGHSLEMRDVYLEQDDPDSWLPSGQLGGSPGLPNTALELLPTRSPVRINEALLLTEAGSERWLELFNDSGETLDLSGFVLTTDRDISVAVRLAAGTQVAAHSWLRLGEAELGLDLEPSDAGDGPSRLFVALLDPDASHVIDAVSFRPEVRGMSEARLPDGGVDFSARAVPTPGDANRVDVETAVVIHEIMYHPFEDRPEAEFVELYNRSDRAVELSGWRLSKGVDFDFPDGTRIEAGGHLVVGRDPQYLRETYGLDTTQVLGPDPASKEVTADFGRLRNGGERINLRDANDNLVDTVRYDDGGQWPVWPDGGGSSLELIDPMQENDFGAAWDASDDSAKASTQEFTYKGLFRSSSNGVDNELRLALLGRGVTLIDDLRVFETIDIIEPTTTFASPGDTWRYLKGTDAPSEPLELWRQIDFDDTDWLSGSAPMGYGLGGEATLLDDMRLGYVSVFLRKKFDVPDPTAVSNLVLEIEYNDGFIAYLNGTRIASVNMEDREGGHNDRATGSAELGLFQAEIAQYQEVLVPGDNVLAIQGHNRSRAGVDFRISAHLADGTFVKGDGPNKNRDGSFEEELRFGSVAPGEWLFQGNHVRTARTTARPISGNASLRVVATGRGDNKGNLLDVGLTRVRPGQEYNISFRARWVVGTPTILTQGWEHSFPQTHHLEVPRNLGTPGAANTTGLRRMDETGDTNLGPVLWEARHEPALPAPGEDTEVSVRALDPDGVASVKVVWSLNTPIAKATELLLEGPDRDGRYHGTIPGQGAQDRVVYAFIAVDGDGWTSRYPREESEMTHPRLEDPENPDPTAIGFLVYGHDDPLDSPYQRYRFWMHDLNEEFLDQAARLSNQLVEGTFIFDERDVYYGTGVRMSGSPFARGEWSSFRVGMPKDRPLHGTIRRFQLENHQIDTIAALERVSNYLIRHNQGGIQVPFFYQWLVFWQLNQRVSDNREHVGYPNGEFIERWFRGGDDGDFVEIDDRHVVGDNGNRIGGAEGRLVYPPHPSDAETLGLSPDNKELYRWYFNLRARDQFDDYDGVIELARLLTPSETPDAEFDERVWDLIDVEEFLRIWAIRQNTDDWDTWGTSRGKNAYLYRSSMDGRWRLLPWDMELTYSNNSSFLPPSLDNMYTSPHPAVERMLNRPRIRRMYYGILKEMIDHQFNPEFVEPFLTKLQEVGLKELQRVRGFIPSRLRQLTETSLAGATAAEVPLEVTTNGGEHLVTSDAVVTLRGRAPVEIMSILAHVDDRPLATGAVELATSSVLGWRSQVPLTPGTHTVSFFGFDRNEALIDSDTITVELLDGSTGGLQKRGDATQDGRIDISDAIGLLGALRGTAKLPCSSEEGNLELLDNNGDGILNLPDALQLLNYLFAAGAPGNLRPGCLDVPGCPTACRQ